MKELKNVKHIHLIAICGTAMGALAGMLVDKGFRVTGSDQGVYPPMSDYLKGLGIEIMEGFKPENLDVNPDMVIVGNTVKKINPEAQELVARGIPYTHLPGAISEYFLKYRHPVVVAGTHGKTTTTALTSWILESAGKDPGFLVGGILKNFSSNNKVGSGEFFVIEGDEYDSSYFDKVPKMWHYRPQTAIITSVEFDHGDIYRDLQHVKEAFAKFVCMIPPTGYLVACADYDNVLEVIEPGVCQVETYGYSSDADVRIVDLELSPQGAAFTLMRGGKEICHLKSPMWGRHNAANATAAALVAMRHGLTVEQIQEGLDSFAGIKRRQEIIYEKDGVIIIDDFAHHPTKVRETVKAVRSRYPDRRLIAVYEPRTNTSRRNFFQNVYPASFEKADLVLVAAVYNLAQIEPGAALDPEELVRKISLQGTCARYANDVEEIIDFLGTNVRRGDVILIMSNGGFGGIYKRLPEKINSRNLVRPAGS